MVGFAVPYALFRGLGFGIFTSVELTIIVVTFLGYCTAFLLLYRTLNFGLIPSCVGAMFFAFSSPKIQSANTPATAIRAVAATDLSFRHPLCETSRKISQQKAAVLLSLAAVCLNLQLATTFYYGWFFVLWTILFLLLALAFRDSRVFIFTTVRKFRPALTVSAIVFLVGFIPMVLVYLPTLRTAPWYLWDFVSGFIPVWRAFLSMGDGNYIWGRFHQWLMPHPRPPAWGELMVGIGLIPTLAWITLTVACVWFIKSRRREGQPQRDVGLLFLGILILATGIFSCLRLSTPVTLPGITSTDTSLAPRRFEPSRVT
jgi:hypothetical protein